MNKKCTQCGYKRCLGNANICHRCYYKKHPKKLQNKIKYNSKYWSNHQERRAEIMKKSNLKRKYKLTPEEYEQMFIDHNNQCAICGYKHLPEYVGTNKSIGVDHNHDTGRVRGLLCRKCNTGLGCFNDDIDLLEKAIYYLSTQDNSTETT